MTQNLDLMFQTATPDTVSDTMKWLVQNNVINFCDWTTKFGGYIPFDFRIDQAGCANSINGIGEKLADRVIEIEKDLDVEFDSLLCSLYSGIFGGIGATLWLQKKYNRNFKVAVSRRSYNQNTGVRAWSVHPLKEKSFTGELGKHVLIHDEMTNTGDTIRELIGLCREKNIEPLAAMILADRILDPLPPNSHIRIIDNIPCYSMITHYEIVEWCRNNQLIWQELRKDRQ